MSLPVGKYIPMVPSDGLRQIGFGVALAILVVPHSVLVLCFGLTGSEGNSLFTGAVLTIVPAAVCLLCFRRGIVLLPADYLFLALVLWIVLSSAFNGQTSNVREYGMLAISLAAYPACRMVSRADIVAGRSSFIRATAIVVALGSIATAVTLWQEWNEPHGRPLVFGFDAAATYFLGSLSFLVIALVTAGGWTPRRTALVSASIFLPAAIYAASLVRFTFLALAGALGLAVILSEATRRKHVIAIGVVILVAMGVGQLARYNRATIYVDYAVEALQQQNRLAAPAGSTKPETKPEIRPPSCYLKLNLQNSFGIRRALFEDAFFLIPRSGWFGTGLDSFMNLSCIKATEIHNSVLQAAVEFGWLGGALLLALMVAAAGPILPLARYDDAARFMLCSLAFVILLSFAHGRISRDEVLFALLGCAVGFKETVRAPATPAAVG